MQLSILTTKTENFYAAYSPELEVICYGDCQDEALNNLQDELRLRAMVATQETLCQRKIAF